MAYLLLGVGLLLLVYLAAGQVERVTARAVKLAFYATLFIVAIAVVLLFIVIGRYGLAAPAGAFALWAMRAWLLARQLKASGQQETSSGDAVTTSGMSRSEALDVLGLQAAATAEEIEAAYRALIVKNHPDQGGTDWLAARLNEARAVLLDD